MKKFIIMPLVIAVAFTAYFLYPKQSEGDNDLNYFLIGVWAQPPKTDDHTDNFGFWKSLGINTLVGHDSGPQKKITEKEWDAAAKAYGLKVIRKPSADLNYDLTQYSAGNLVAWMVPDENDKIAANKGKWDQSTLQEAIYNYTTPLRAKNAQVPIFANFMGSQFGYGRDNWYKQAIAAVDFYAYDWYPFNTGYEVYTTLIERMQKITAWGGKYSLGYIETSDQRLKKDPSNQNPAYSYRVSRMRGPTPQEIRMEMAVAVAQGAPGLIFFVDSFYPFEYDGTTPAGIEMMKQEIAVWNKLTADPGQPIVNLPEGLVGQRRMYNGSYKKIIANYTTNTIKVGSQTFGPYDYKILNDSENIGTVVANRPIPNPPPANPNTSTGNNGNTGGNSNQNPTPTLPTYEWTATCSASKTKATVNEYVSWYVRPSNGTRSNTYVWNGVPNATYSSYDTQFTTSGVKQMSVTVRSKDGQTKTVNCPNIEIIDVPVVAACNVSVIPEGNGARVTWSSYIYGSASSYSWIGTDGLSSNAASVEKFYATAGTKDATLRITSGNQTINLPCRVVLPSTKQMSGYCYASPRGDRISWKATGGERRSTTSYLWSGNGMTEAYSSMYSTYTDLGVKTAYVAITDSSINSTLGLQCAATATINE